MSGGGGGLCAESSLFRLGSNVKNFVNMVMNLLVLTYGEFFDQPGNYQLSKMTALWSYKCVNQPESEA
jgi:hypothetical protein